MEVTCPHCHTIFQTEASPHLIEPIMAEEAPITFPEETTPFLEEPPVRNTQRLWVIVTCVIALPIFLLQTLITWRVELSVLSPELKPTLLVLCEWAGCEVPLPHKINLITVESSDMHPFGPASDHRLQLVATLKNRASFPQAWPHLDLTITDETDRVILRKVLPPSGYLPPHLVETAGFPASSEHVTNLILGAPDLPTAGYRFHVFYP
ncbi:MAG: DUF3426 domain-containing protein [Rhodocyclaceae bacterium]|nr:DUF3426 domain-containing protein [Rhodocyclaceae bacterium]